MFQERTRFCVNGEIGDPGCDGEESENIECNLVDCGKLS